MTTGCKKCGSKMEPTCKPFSTFKIMPGGKKAKVTAVWTKCVKCGKRGMEYLS